VPGAPGQSGPTAAYGQGGYPGTSPQYPPGYGTGQFPPPGGGGPGTGWYGQPPQPPKSGKGKIVAIVAGIAVVLLVVAVGAVVLLNQGSSTPAAPPVTGGPQPTGQQSAPPSAPTSASVPPGQPQLAQVFPDVTSSNCQQVDTAANPLRSQSGAVATEVYYCDYGSVAPGARVIFARWADAQGARAWYDDTARLGPRIENFDVWQAGGVQQGPLYTAQSNGTVYSTGIYDGLNYSWEIRTSNLDQSNQVFDRLQFRARTTFGG
jgi:serine/threonine-protein kinase